MVERLHAKEEVASSILAVGTVNCSLLRIPLYN